MPAIPFALPKRLFPLHLTDIERFLLADDRPGYPMAFVIELSFAGLIDPDQLRAALLDALARHPLLAAKLGPAKNKRHCWLTPDGEVPTLDVGPLGAPIELPDGEWMDLEHHVGLRLWLRTGCDDQSQPRSVLTCQFHHVCCDGIGAYRFLGDLLSYYDIHHQSPSDGAMRQQLADESIPPLNIQRLRGRADRCKLNLKTRASKEIRNDSIRYAWQVVGKSGQPLTPPKSPRGPLPGPFPGVSSVHFSQSEAKSLRDAAKDMGLMLNDLLLLELFNSCRQWNEEQERVGPQDPFRIMMPVDLRNQEDFETPACNVVGYTFLTRTPAQLDQPEQLALSIREETAGIKHNRSGERFVEMVGAGAQTPGLLKLITRLPRTLCTVVLSNVGDPSRRFLGKFKRQSGRIVVGDVVLEHITGYPPMRPKSRATCSIVQYRRELSIGIRCDPHRFAMEDGQHLLDIYTQRLRQHLSDQ